MKLIYTGILSIACLIGGYQYGKKTNPEPVNNEKYSILLSDSTTQIKAHNLDKTYDLTTINGELYLGNAQHNFDGAAKLIFQEAKNSTQKNNKTIDDTLE